MNLKPKIRPLWQRVIIMFALTGLMVWKYLRLPYGFFPRSIRSIIQHWTYEMFSVIIRTWVTKAPVDQTCVMARPSSFRPLVEVDPEFRLDEREIKSFYQNGFLGPFDAYSMDEIKQLREIAMIAKDTVSETYGWNTPRDRHFEILEMFDMMKKPAVTERLAQLLGPDLLVWRSQFFYKMAGAERIQWHQASTFMVEDYLDPALFPADLSQLFQITAWVAIDQATLENGCLEFACGTHDKIRNIRFGGEEGFYESRFTLEFDEDDVRVQQVPAKPGQVILFTERCIHGSPPNKTKTDRLAFNFRVVPTNVAVYTDKKYYRSVYNGGKYHLDNWGVTTIRGEDKLKLSRIWTPPENFQTVKPEEERTLELTKSA